jgi:hypothetical protein
MLLERRRHARRCDDPRRPEFLAINKLEPLYAFTRKAELRDAGAARPEMDAWLELGASAPTNPQVIQVARSLGLGAVPPQAMTLRGIEALLRRHVLSGPTGRVTSW